MTLRFLALVVFFMRVQSTRLTHISLAFKKCVKSTNSMKRRRDMTDIYLLIDDQQQGPYTEKHVRQSLGKGSITC